MKFLRFSSRSRQLPWTNDSTDALGWWVALGTGVLTGILIGSGSSGTFHFDRLPGPISAGAMIGLFTGILGRNRRVLKSLAGCLLSTAACTTTITLRHWTTGHWDVGHVPPRTPFVCAALAVLIACPAAIVSLLVVAVNRKSITAAALPFMKSLIRDTFRTTAWWAPAAVLILHEVVAQLGLRREADWLMHFSGGLAISYFLWTAIPLLARWLGPVTTAWRFVLTFTCGCTAALIWDLAEFASDQTRGTHIQQSLKETMLDFTNGFAGISLTTCLLLVAVAIRTRSQRRPRV